MITFEGALRTSEVLLGAAVVQQAAEHLAGASRDRPWFVAQSLFAVGMAIGLWPALAEGLLLAASIATLHRFGGPYNGGSDRIRLLLLSCLFAARVSPTDTWGHIAVGYFAVQLVLSYTAAGWAKLANPEWRTGQALRDVFEWSVYPVSDQLRSLASAGGQLFALSWIIMLFEVLFPLSLMNAHALQVALVVAFMFHLANACVFGLNRFLWAWVAGYPCLLWFQETVLSKWFQETVLLKM